MSKTKLDIKNDLKDKAMGAGSYEEMIDRFAVYIIKNYKLKKITITTTVKSEGLKP